VNPNFTKTARHATVLTTGAVTTMTSVTSATSNVISLITGVATYGTRINSITAKAVATNAATLCNVWISYNGGTSCFLYDQLIVPAATMSATVPAGRVSATYADLILRDASSTIYVASYTSDVLHVTASGGDLDV
jgi:hypothetical protein